MLKVLSTDYKISAQAIHTMNKFSNYSHENMVKFINL